jgi:catechol 2,3-dioxygenase-like lactoylglutathione lyase family enzyme
VHAGTVGRGGDHQCRPPGGAGRQEGTQLAGVAADHLAGAGGAVAAGVGDVRRGDGGPAVLVLDADAVAAQVETPPKQHQYEKRCYIRDPDGHLIEVGQTTDPAGDWTPAHWPSGTAGGETE